MSTGTWTMIYQLASRRHDTKQGFDHMSDHGHEVLQKLCMEEAEDAVTMALGNTVWFPVPG